MRRIVVICLLIGIAVCLSGAESDYTELIVTVKDNSSINLVADVTHAVIAKKVQNAPVYLLRTGRQNDSRRLLAEVRQIPGVQTAEENLPIVLAGTDAAAPSYANLAHALADLLDGNARVRFYGVEVLKAYAEQPALSVIRATAVRGISTGVGTRVAYIDTGVDPNHPALQPWLEPGVDVIRGNSASEIDGLDHAMSDLLDHAMSDLLDKRFFFVLHSSETDGSFPPAFGHGTMVAGLIHAVAPEARIFPIKAFDPYGRTSVFAIVDGVYHAIDADADVLNMSFSTDIDSPAFHRALDSAKASGMALTAAVGNEGTDADLFPAAYSAVYGVAATDANDKVADFSNYGAAVKVSAPGVLVISTAPAGRYAIASGTSFSAPIVGGAIALVSSTRARGLTDQALIATTADSIDALNPGFERKLGMGRINLQQALRPGR
jgi:subtilisin family serine protease